MFFAVVILVILMKVFFVNTTHMCSTSLTPTIYSPTTAKPVSRPTCYETKLLVDQKNI